MTADVPVPLADRSTDPSRETVTLRKSAEPSCDGPMKIVPAIPAGYASMGCATVTLASTAVAIATPARRSSVDVSGVEWNAGGFAVDDRVERAAERDVSPERPRPESHVHAALQDEGRHVDERDAANALACPRGAGADGAGRRVEGDGVAIRHGDEAALEDDRGDGDDAVTAHRRVSAVVHEQHAGVRPGRGRFGQHRAAHVAVAARLAHHDAAQPIGVPLGPGALFGHRPAARRRKAVDDQPQRRAAHVRVDCPDRDHCDRTVTEKSVRSAGVRGAGVRCDVRSAECGVLDTVPSGTRCLRTQHLAHRTRTAPRTPHHRTSAPTRSKRCHSSIRARKRRRSVSKTRAARPTD